MFSRLYHNRTTRLLVQAAVTALLLLWLLLPLLVSAQPIPPSLPPSNEGAIQPQDSPGTANFMVPVYRFLWDFVLGVFQSFALLGQAALNFSLTNFVFGFGSWFNTTGLGSAVNSLWSTVRDLFNLAFIFGLIYIGFQLILKNDTRAKQTLAYLIIAALLINFSLFATKFIIDFTNITAVQISTFIDKGNLQDDDMGGVFMGITGVTSIYESGKGVVERLAAGGSGASALGYIFMTMIFLIITAIVFFAGAFLLMVRFIALNLFMIFSPVMFLGFIFPNMAGYSSRFWRGFLGRAFMAPIYVFMLYASFLIIAQLNNEMIDSSGYSPLFEGAGIGSQTGANVVDGGSVIVFFLVASGFMIASVVLAQKLGADGANGTIRVMQNIRGRAQRGMRNAATYAPRYVARNVSNKAGEATRRSLTRLQNLDTTKLDPVSAAATRFARGTTVDRVVRGAAANAEKAKFGMATTVAENRKRSREIETRVSDERDKEAGLEAQAKRNAGGTLDETEEKALAKLQSTVTRMRQKEFEDMTQEEREQLAEFMSSNQFDKLMESNELDPTQKGDMAKQRELSVKRLVGDVDEKTGELTQVYTDNLNKLTTSQLETAGQEFIMEYAADLTDKQVDDLKKSKNLTDGQKSQIVAARKDKIDNRVKASPSNPAEFKKLFETTSRGAAGAAPTPNPRKAKDIAKLPPDVLVMPASTRFITASVLEQIDKDRETALTFEQKAKIRSNVLSNPSASADAKAWLNNNPKGQDFGKT